MPKVKQEDPRIAFGRAVRFFRTQRGMSQEALADAAGIHRTYIGDVERGKRNIALVNMHRIADALNVPLSQIIRDVERKKSD